jgi:hypothetical protein
MLLLRTTCRELPKPDRDVVHRQHARSRLDHAGDGVDAMAAVARSPWKVGRSHLSSLLRRSKPILHRLAESRQFHLDFGNIADR